MPNQSSQTSQSHRLQKSSNDPPVAIDTLKLSHGEWIAVIEQIKRIGATDRESDARRQYARAEALGLIQLIIEISQPGGTDMRLLARSHDLSNNGLSFIHGMYIHPNSLCTCWMRHVSQGLKPITGTIRWCRHVSGRIHLSGVQLDEAIRVEDYLACPPE